MRRRFTNLAWSSSLKKVDVKLKRGMKVRLRVRDADGKPIARAFMPLPQVYLARHRKDAWFSLANKDPDTRFPAVERTNFLNVRPEPGGDFTFQLAADQSEPLYFGFSHPDVLLYYETRPGHGVGSRQRSLGRRLAPARDRRNLVKVPGRHGWKTLVRERLLQPDSRSSLVRTVPCRASIRGMIKATQWRTTLKRLAPRAFNIYIQTQPNDGTSARRDMLARAGEFQRHAQA